MAEFPKPVFNNQSVVLRINHENYKTLEEPVWMKTGVFNKRFNLKPWQKICWKIDPPFKTDGASTQATFVVFLMVLFFTWWYGANADTLWIMGSIMLVMQKILNPLSWKLLVPAVGHDEMCRFQFINTPYVFDEREDKIVQELPGFGFRRIRADQFMFYKIDSFDGKFVKFVVFPVIAIWGLFFNKDNLYGKNKKVHSSSKVAGK